MRISDKDSVKMKLQKPLIFHRPVLDSDIGNGCNELKKTQASFCIKRSNDTSDNYRKFQLSRLEETDNLSDLNGA